jgi:hypothetical protein
MIRMILLLIVVFLVATFPATWLLMLFFGNIQTHAVGYWGMLPLGIVASMLISGSSLKGLARP